jgi:uncharacterized protein YdhG (YjbR/CyaY superfamily)
MKQVTSVDEYLEALPEGDRAALERLRKIVKAAAPEAVETISYRMPTFKYHGPLVSFAAFKNHLSFFAMGRSAMDAFSKELQSYDTTKGSIHFTADRPLPAALIKRIVKKRIEENLHSSGVAGRKPPSRRPRHPMPDYVKRALRERGLTEAYKQRPPYQRNDYIGWITQAKQEATRRKRLDQMLDELERGDVYMKMAYKPRKKAAR